MIVRRPTIFSMKEGNQSDNYLAVIHMLKSQMIQYDEIIDATQTFKMSGGRFNPAGDGFFVLLPDYQRVFNSIGLARWIDKEGLMLLV